MSNMDPGKPGRAAKRSAGKQQAAIEKQKKLEALKAMEEEDLIARKKLQAKTGGRSLLVATSPTGVANKGTTTKLGGGQ